MPAILEISFTHTIKRIPFDSVEEAEKVLSELTPLIGMSPYGKNYEQNKSFTIKSAMGSSVINTGAVTCAGVTDYSVYTEQQAVKDFNNHEFNLSERYIKQMVEAGLGQYVERK